MKILFNYKLIPLIFLVILNSCSYWQLKSEYPGGLEILHDNVTNYYLSKPVDVEKVYTIMAGMNENGFWPYIDYASQQRGVWPPAAHVSNLLLLARAYQTEGPEFYHARKLSDIINRAYNYWVENDFQCPNWWYSEIGLPRLLAPTMILMQEELSEEQKELGMKILDRSRIGMSGQNKVWQSGNVLLKAIFLGDIETIRKASGSIQEELVVKMGVGIQADESFHQHGPQLQFGNYGLSYAGDMIKWITILRNTPFQLDESKVSILRNYLLDGLQWVTWKGQLDISACGRQLFKNSPRNKARRLAGFFEAMEKLDRPYVPEYIKANQYWHRTGNKHFWRSDFQVQRDSEYYFSVKMCSERVIGAESANSENIRGYYMGDGATFLYLTGKEYQNIFPFWDWKKIPGTTTHQDDEVLPILTTRGYRIESKFVGGVSDGENGIAVMAYKRDGLKARKSWFTFNNKIVCLGAGITSTAGHPVTTSVNQTFFRGDVDIKKDDKEVLSMPNETLHNPAWILHDKVGYFFPAGGILKLETGAVEGSWHRVASRYPDDKIDARLFKLWFEHGINPSGKKYSCILIPKATKSILADMELKNPFEIWNHFDLQMVKTADNSMAGVVFYKAGQAKVFGGIEVDQPCLVLLKKENTGLKVSVADPSQILDSIQITFKGPFQTLKGANTAKIDFPEGGEAGKTVRLYLKLE
ncbi:MAG: hypothetical protein JJV98_18140 [Desulfosarcina sp.]|nr:hypothetical protein [Desulfobacterales bacterium]